MTKEEINKFLANTKIYVAGKSEEIQKKLFSLGYKWDGGWTGVEHTDSPFLFIYKDMSFFRSNDMRHFSDHGNKEISAEEVLSLELTELTYRPFKDIEECWNEMKKHEPFGYVKSKCDGNYNHYRLITRVTSSTTVSNAANCAIQFQNDTFCYHDMVNLYENYTFADGTPFGIKED